MCNLLKVSQLLDIKANLAMRCLSDLACNTDSSTSLALSLAAKTSTLVLPYMEAALEALATKPVASPFSSKSDAASWGVLQLLYLFMQAADDAEAARDGAGEPGGGGAGVAVAGFGGGPSPIAEGFGGSDGRYSGQSSVGQGHGSTPPQTWYPNRAVEVGEVVHDPMDSYYTDLDNLSDNMRGGGGPGGGGGGGGGDGASRRPKPIDPGTQVALARLIQTLYGAHDDCRRTLIRVVGNVETLAQMLTPFALSATQKRYATQLTDPGAIFTALRDELEAALELESARMWSIGGFTRGARSGSTRRSMLGGSTVSAGPGMNMALCINDDILSQAVDGDSDGDGAAAEAPKASKRRSAEGRRSKTPPRERGRQAQAAAAAAASPPPTTSTTRGRSPRPRPARGRSTKLYLEEVDLDPELELERELEKADKAAAEALIEEMSGPMLESRSS